MKRIALIALIVLSLSLVFAVSCYDIQYTTAAGSDGTYPSIYAGGVPVTVEGIVTEDSYATSSGDTKFYISDPAGGPWTGLYIYKWLTGVVRGDFVSVTGPVVEYAGLTEISGTSTTVNIISHGNELPPAYAIQTTVCAYPSDPAVAEQWECCLTKFENITVTEAPGTHRYFKVDDGSGVGEITNYGYQPYSTAWQGIPITVGQTFASVSGIIESYKAPTSTSISYALCPRDNDDFVVTANEDNYVVLPDASLIGNYPNPFAGNTTIAYNLKSAQNVQIQVFNLKGQLVRTLVSGKQAAQLHNITFDGKDNNGNLLASGMYMYKLTAGTTVQTRKLVIR